MMEVVEELLRTVLVIAALVGAGALAVTWGVAAAKLAILVSGGPA